MRYFFYVAYDGSNYGGWQRQTGVPSVQQSIETAFSTVLQLPCAITGAGRTDAGVHARALGAHIDLPQELDVLKCERGINAVLPRDIAIQKLQVVANDFHARFSAIVRQYTYAICQHKSPLLGGRVWTMYYRVDWEKIQAMIGQLSGAHDFAAFCAARSSSAHARCTVTDASLTNQGDVWMFTISANRFVYKMVRSIVGTLIDIGRGYITDSIADIIASCDRRKVGATAPPWGLTLERVDYPSGTIVL